MNIATNEGSEAVLICDGAVGWYRSLFEEGNALPGEPGEWNVEVVVVPVGWIGVFKRSPQTGLWYAGEHDVHLHGN